MIHRLCSSVSRTRTLKTVLLGRRRHFCSSTFAGESDSNSAIELIVVRHGETEWNRDLRVQGVTDVPLNDKGRLQAEACAAALAHLSSTTSIYSSQMSRASDTARAIAAVLSSTSSSSAIPVSTHGALNEWNLGVLEGLVKQEASERYPADWDVFSQWANPLTLQSTIGISKGESMEDVRTRVVSYLESLVAKYCSNKPGSSSPIVVVTHGGVLGQLLRHVLVAQYPKEQQNDIRTKLSGSNSLESSYRRPQNACITRFAIDLHNKEWKILEWATTSHLEGDAAPIDTNYNAGVQNTPQ